MVELGLNNELIQRRPTHMEQDQDPQPGVSDVEMEDATPKARDFQPNADGPEPYKTPMILKRRRGLVIEDSSDIEIQISEKQRDVTDKEERRVKTCRVSETKVCVVCVPRR
jgi:hypothetical protein